MNVVADMLLTPAPAVIWATLTVLTLPALLLLGSPEGMRQPRQAARELVAALRRHREQLRLQAEEAAQSARFAEELHVAAGRAAASAERWQQVWQRSVDEVDAAWQSWLAADARLRAVRAAAAWGTPATARTCEEYADRDRFLHRTVAAAVARGDLPPEAVADAQAGRNGWDARLHPADQEVVIARASAAWLRQRYEQATAAERTAWHDAELARRTRDDLQREVAATAVADGAGPSRRTARSGAFTARPFPARG
ncbi:hypothetical protein AB0J80_33830 [Actinoplanes sp. NPDC049548]|uniref:hypothetical protein n=1 Tax=Actinoplanes sp. NPDC049548 TaxID=3155152 RepID=UPI00342FFB24